MAGFHSQFMCFLQTDFNVRTVVFNNSVDPVAPYEFSCIPALPSMFLIKTLPASAELKLLESVIFDSRNIPRPTFPPILPRRPGLRNRFNPFHLPIKNTKNFMPRVLYPQSNTL